MRITKEIRIDELIEMTPKAVGFLAQKGIHCIACGEPVWGTLEELAKQKGLRDIDVDEMVIEIERL
ncbi:MAG: DUF1858 domain-containing protein [Bacteroidetes bacterium GWF2_33_16]|nr:MAG: DUF1858 domain-containing protein [Bacteroidetes bacterium GWE2_32_14]OFY08817.1 MAG: DUF1858 domain-containing protein [Bacteroidetes bacterium GWF2_33_16]